MASTNHNDKPKSRKFKVIGGALLLLSFIVQNFMYDYWNKEDEEYINVKREFSAMSRSGIIYLNLYFSVNTGDSGLNSDLRRQFINAAAMKSAMGQSIDIIARDIDKQDKIDMSNALQEKAAIVKDLNSYLKFVEYSNRINPNSLQYEVDRVGTIGIWRDGTRYIFLFSYLLGSVILLLGIKYE